MIRTKAQTMVAAAAAVLLAVGLAGCGGSSSSDSSSVAPTATETTATPTEPSPEPAESVSDWAEGVYDSIDTMSDTPRTEQLLALVAERRAAVEALGATVEVTEAAGRVEVKVVGDQTCEVIADDNEMSIEYSCY